MIVVLMQTPVCYLSHQHLSPLCHPWVNESVSKSESTSPPRLPSLCFYFAERKQLYQANQPPEVIHLHSYSRPFPPQEAASCDGVTPSFPLFSL